MTSSTDEVTVDLSVLTDEIQDLMEHISELQTIGEGLRLQANSREQAKFKAQLSRLDSTYSKLEEKITRAMICTKTLKRDCNDLNAKRKIARSQYFEILAMADVVAPADTSESLLNTTRTSLTYTAPTFKLPTINLPTFDGNVSHWPMFKDTFLALIHNNVDLAPIQKYHYLRSSLKSAALQAIATIPLTEMEYPQAWDNLLKKYENKRLQAVNHLHKIFTFPPISKCTLSSLQKLTEVVFESATSFQKLDIREESGFILMTYILRLLNTTLREKFETKYSANNEIPTLQNLMDFIHSQELLMQAEACTVTAVTGGSQGPSVVRPNTSETRRVLYTGENTKSKPINGTTCLSCQQNHRLYNCTRFKTMNPVERTTFLKSHNVCYNCLSVQHTTKQCNSRSTCRQCGRRHNTLLHWERKPNGNQTSASGPSREAENTVLTSSVQENQNVLLSTVQARIKDRQGKLHPLRMIIDCGAQRSFITKELADRLKLPKFRNPHSLCGFGDVPITDGLFQTRCSITTNSWSKIQLNTNAVVIKQICRDMPVNQLPKTVLLKYKNLHLADPNYWKPGKIDFLLGADLFPSILENDPTMKGAPHNAIRTIFGWVIMGSIDIPSHYQPQATALLTIDQDTTQALTKVVQRFWEVEEVETAKKENPQDAQCEAHFVSTHTREASGRYRVRLPFKDTPLDLSTSRTIALHRFYNLEGRLEKQEEIKQAYSQIITEHLSKKYIAETKKDGNYYLPHHGVYKGENAKSLRIVYDAACATKKGSLNDHLLSGPKLQKEIRDVLLGFRLHVYAMAADICQMFLQIMVHPEDCKYQHFVYRFSKQEAIKCFEINRLPFGLTCSPYLALRVMQQLCQDEGANHTEAAKALQNDMYVDDLLTGGGTLEQAQHLQQDVISLLSKGGFELKKWCANDPALLKEVKEERSGVLSLSGLEDGIIKILGLQWDPAQDCLSYRIQSRENVPTKRGIMSTIARMYDLLGYLAPVVFHAKTILQSLWKENHDWDAEVSSSLEAKWDKYYEQLIDLKTVQIPRLIPCLEATGVDVIGFADASADGYAAVIYLRSEDAAGTAQTYLVMAKTKLAPLKTQSIPRLELCGALLLVKTINALSEFLSKLTIRNTYLFLDAATVLAWIRTPVHRLKTFVANRVAIIQDLSSQCLWYHVPTTENAADIASRGCTPSEIAAKDTWWHGPQWLTLPPSDWPLKEYRHADLESQEIPELKETVLLAKTVIDTPILALLRKVSTYPKLIRIVAYCKRFITNCKIRDAQARSKGPLTLKEMDEAKLTVITEVQRSDFNDEKSLHKLRSLAPFHDSRGVLRVGGRLKNSPLPEDAQNPILLNRRRFVELLIDHLHKIHLHAGPQLLQAIIRNQYWIVSARGIVRSRVHQCIKCHRLRVKGYNPYMSDLPSSRFTQGRAFNNVGVDFAGPFCIKESKRRKAQVGKAYMCLFICMSTKAVHCEVVSDLTTEAFLACLDRFVARRGLPAHIYSDNGTNFVGANRQLKELQQWWRSDQLRKGLADHLTKREIGWSFNPPYAPHFGGLWEANIKSFKTHLIRVIDQHTLTFEELTTITSRIEALLNSRPLYPLSSDPESYEVLTPGHFLTGAPLTARLDWDWTETPENRLSRWEFLRQCTQLLWKKWKTDYLHHLQQRVKWKCSTKEVQVGTLVLMREENAPPMEWTTERITHCHIGPDGVTRVVEVKTPYGTYTRALTSLSPLFPIPSSPQT